MISITKINKPTVFLVMYFILLFEIFFPVDVNNIYTSIVLRFLRYAALLSYYFFSCKKMANEIIGVILLSLCANIFLSFSKSSIVMGYILIMLYKVLLVHYSYKKIDYKKISFKMIVPVFLMFLGVIFLVLFLHYTSDFLFYLVIVNGFILVFLLTLSYVNVLGSTKKGNLKYFMAFSVITIADAVFGLDYLYQNNAVLFIIITLLYNLAFFLLLQSDIENKKEIC